MALQGPDLRKGMLFDFETDADPVERALVLAREIEQLLEDAPTSSRGATRSQSSRIARAISASLVDELEALAYGRRKSQTGDAE